MNVEATVDLLAGLLVWGGAVGVFAGGAYKLLARRASQSSAPAQQTAYRKEQSR